MKANKIIEMSQEKSRQKVKLAMDEIQRMRNEGERITVSGLCKRTGLSNSFFYRNPKIKEEVHKAVDIQNQSYKMNIVSDGTLWEVQTALFFRWTCLPDCAVPELAADYRRNNRRLS